jgi:hypothetical protein
MFANDDIADCFKKSVDITARKQTTPALQGKGVKGKGKGKEKDNGMS